jgi:hypothetical protein
MCRLLGRRYQPCRDPGLNTGDPGPLGNRSSSPVLFLSLLHNSSLAGPYRTAGTRVPWHRKHLARDTGHIASMPMLRARAAPVPCG